MPAPTPTLPRDPRPASDAAAAPPRLGTADAAGAEKCPRAATGAPEEGAAPGEVGARSRARETPPTLTPTPTFGCASETLADRMAAIKNALGWVVVPDGLLVEPARAVLARPAPGAAPDCALMSARARRGRGGDRSGQP